MILEKFVVNTDGTITRKSDNKTWKGYKYPNGYYMIEVTINKKKYREYVHRLVATKYLPNPDNLAYVNHKDGVKTNNHVDNLEWCTHSHNMKHANVTGLRKTGKTTQPVRCIELDMVFTSQREALEYLGKNPRSPLIGYACRGHCSTNNCKTAYGYTWELVKG